MLYESYMLNIGRVFLNSHSTKLRQMVLTTMQKMIGVSTHTLCSLAKHTLNSHSASLHPCRCINGN